MVALVGQVQLDEPVTHHRIEELAAQFDAVLVGELRQLGIALQLVPVGLLETVHADLAAVDLGGVRIADEGQVLDAEEHERDQDQPHDDGGDTPGQPFTNRLQHDVFREISRRGILLYAGGNV